MFECVLVKDVTYNVLSLRADRVIYGYTVIHVSYYSSCVSKCMDSLNGDT